MSKNFTAICFVISGIISCILTRFSIKLNFKLLGLKVNLSPYIIQLLVFLIVGIFLILVVRPHFLAYLEKKKEEKDTQEKEKKLEKKNSKKEKKEKKKNKRKK